MSYLAIHCSASGRIIETLHDEVGFLGDRAARRMLSGYVAPGGMEHLALMLDLARKQGAVSEWLIDLQGHHGSMRGGIQGGMVGADGVRAFRLWVGARSQPADAGARASAQGADVQDGRPQAGSDMGQGRDDLLILGAADDDGAPAQATLEQIIAAVSLDGPRGDALAPLVAAIRARAADPAAVAADLRAQVRGLKGQVQPPPMLEHRLLGMAAHDLRNPLLVLSMGCSYLLHDAKELSEEHRTMLSESLDTCEFMNRMVEGMVDLAQVAAGAPRLSREATDLAALVEGAIRRHAPVAREREMTLALAESAPVVAEVDAARITQVVDQLLSNALTHCPAGTTVRVGLALEDGEAVITVQDDGPGIPPGIEEALFQPFGKPHAAADPRRYGAGVGLTIARYVVERHDGCIDVDTAPGKGCRFTVTLPVAPIA